MRGFLIVAIATSMLQYGNAEGRSFGAKSTGGYRT
jgi:hypothetical protein